LKRRNSSKSLGREKGLRPVTIISLMLDPVDMVILSFDKGWQVKVPPMLLLHSTNIGYLTLSLNEVMVVDFHFLGLLVLSVGRRTRLSVQPARMVASVVVRVVTK